MAVKTKPKPIRRRKGGFAVHKKSGGGGFVVRDSFRDTAKAISQIKSGLPVKVFFALKGQLLWTQRVFMWPKGDEFV